MGLGCGLSERLWWPETIPWQQGLCIYNLSILLTFSSVRLTTHWGELICSKDLKNTIQICKCMHSLVLLLSVKITFVNECVLVNCKCWCPLDFFLCSKDLQTNYLVACNQIINICNFSIMELLIKVVRPGLQILKLFEGETMSFAVTLYLPSSSMNRL